MEDQAKAYAIELGARIRYHRKLLGKTQMHLAKVLGCSFQQVQKYERGDNRISPYRLAVLREYLKLDWCTIMPPIDINHT